MLNKKFTFDEKKHAYYLNGVKMTGVTSILGVIDKPALIQWSANMAVDYVASNLMSAITYPLDNNKITEVFNLARKAWAKNRDSAGGIGTQCHYWIEQFVKAKINGSEYIPNYESENVKKMVEKFIEWSVNENITFLLSEQKIYSTEHFYAGTVDIVFEKGGKKYIGDIKTAKDIYSTNYLQMAGYHICFEELGKLKDLAGYCVINIPKIVNEKVAKIKVKYVKDTKTCKRTFLSVLDLYRYINKEKPAWQKKLKK